jgi:hypothetical protein
LILISQYKGLAVCSLKRYTILLKSYIIHTLGGEEWKSGRMEGWEIGTPIAIGGNVEALAEIPLRRENVGKLE